MALPTKPSDRPEWATDVGALVTAPPQPKREQGWIVEKPPVSYQNWMMKFIYLWLVYLEGLSDILKLDYDVYVKTTGGTHTDLKAALADAGVVAGMKILVCEDQTVDTAAITVGKAVEIVLKPGVSIKKGTSANGVSITTNGVRIKGGKINGFSAGGNKGVVIGSGITRVKIGEVDFSNNTTDIDDTDGQAAVYGCHFSV